MLEYRFRKYLRFPKSMKSMTLELETDLGNLKDFLNL